LLKKKLEQYEARQVEKIEEYIQKITNDEIDETTSFPLKQ